MIQSRDRRGWMILQELEAASKLNETVEMYEFVCEHYLGWNKMHQSYISEAQSLDESKGPVPTLEEIGFKPVDEGKGSLRWNIKCR